MKRHANTLFVTTDGAYLRKEGQTVAVRIDGETRLRVPLHHLDGIVTMGRVGASPALLGACGEAGVSVSFHSSRGRFLARVTGFTPGNVLLRREQYRCADDPARALVPARAIVAAKIANSRTVLLRACRDHADLTQREQIQHTTAYLSGLMDDVQRATDPQVLRGFEGDGAKRYFAVFDQMLTSQRDEFRMNGRSRRPPTDNLNAMLSFVYTILTHDARSACESAGLDPAVGFLHRDRPGRPGLALDLIEEFRAFLADRLVLSLINRRQVAPEGFDRGETGGVAMNDATRKTVLLALQKRKQDEITHPFLNEKTTVGLLLHLQAQLLARFLRGDLDAYPPFIAR